MKDHPIPDDQLDKIYLLARKTAVYRQALTKQGITDDLADRLTRDWHMLQLDQPLTAHNLTERIIVQVLQALRRARSGDYR